MFWADKCRMYFFNQRGGAVCSGLSWGDGEALQIPARFLSAEAATLLTAVAPPRLPRGKPSYLSQLVFHPLEV